MTETMFHAVLAKAEATSSKRGPSTLPDGKLLTLYLASNGASMQVGKVVALRLEGDIVEAKNKKGELFLFNLGDIYGACITDEGSEDGSGRKAGFLDR